MLFNHDVLCYTLRVNLNRDGLSYLKRASISATLALLATVAFSTQAWAADSGSVVSDAVTTLVNSVDLPDDAISPIEGAESDQFKQLDSTDATITPSTEAAKPAVVRFDSQQIGIIPTELIVSNGQWAMGDGLTLNEALQARRSVQP